MNLSLSSVGSGSFPRGSDKSGLRSCRSPSIGSRLLTRGKSGHTNCHMTRAADAVYASLWLVVRVRAMADDRAFRIWAIVAGVISIVITANAIFD